MSHMLHRYVANFIYPPPPDSTHAPREPGAGSRAEGSQDTATDTALTALSLSSGLTYGQGADWGGRDGERAGVGGRGVVGGP